MDRETSRNHWSKFPGLLQGRETQVAAPLFSPLSCRWIGSDPHFPCLSLAEFARPQAGKCAFFILPFIRCVTVLILTNTLHYPYLPPATPPATCCPDHRVPFRKMECWIFQDKTDDVKMGIRSTALLFGEHTRSALSALSVTSVGLIGTAGYMTDTLLTGVVGIPFYAGLGVGALQLARVLMQTDFNDRTSCWKGFVGCGWSGFWIWMGAAGNYFYLML